MKTDLQDYNARYAVQRRALDKRGLLAENKQLILEFDNLLAAQRLTKARRTKYLEVLGVLGARLGKPFKEVTRDDLVKLFAEIQGSDKSVWTKNTYAVIVKRFWRWLRGLEGTKKYPEEVAWMATGVPRHQQRLPRAEELLTEADVKALLAAARHPRDKAFIHVLWESGARVGEVGNLTIEEVTFDKSGAVMSVEGKTGSRRVRLVESVPSLALWLTVHPWANEPQRPLWPCLTNTARGRRLTYQGFRKMLRQTAEKADVTKRVNPHTFRHSRATHLANHLTEFQMNSYLGWVQGSNMAGTYVHLSGKQVDQALFKMNGMTDQATKQAPVLEPRTCPRCEITNEPDAKFCRRCGGPFDSVSAVREAWEEREREDELAKALAGVVELKERHEAEMTARAAEQAAQLAKVQQAIEDLKTRTG